MQRRKHPQAVKIILKKKKYKGKVSLVFKTYKWFINKCGFILEMQQDRQNSERDPHLPRNLIFNNGSRRILDQKMLLTSV